MLQKKTNLRRRHSVTQENNKHFQYQEETTAWRHAAIPHVFYAMSKQPMTKKNVMNYVMRFYLNFPQFTEKLQDGLM